MMLAPVARNWWIFLVRGIIAILFAIGTWVWPDLTVTVMLILFVSYAIGEGGSAFVSAVMFGGEGRWLPQLLTGVAGIAIAIIAALWPDLTALALMVLIAVWAMVTGVFQIATAIQLRREIEGEWALILAGLGSVIFGVVAAIFPGAGAVALNWVVGLLAFWIGVLLIVVAFRLRSLRDTLPE
jgi:uncharacterized membrane protein HdeD (DUF308 family)